MFTVSNKSSKDAETTQLRSEVIKLSHGIFRIYVFYNISSFNFRIEYNWETNW